MPIFRRFGRPGLLGAVTRGEIIAGTAIVTARVISSGERVQRAGPAGPVDDWSGGASYPQRLTPSLSQQLSALSQLHAAGEISDAEFLQAKTQLLAAG